MSAAPTGAISGEPQVEPEDHITRTICGEPARAAQHAAEQGGEVIRLRWKLSGFLGFLAGLFVPNSGDALLTFVPRPEDRVEIQFLVTAPRREGEYYLYGAEVDARSAVALTIWNSENIKDKRKDREVVIDDPRTIDYASAVYRLRWHGVERPSKMTIWDRGHFYTVEVEPLGTVERKIGGNRMPVRGYVIRGADGEEDRYGDRIWLYFAQDDHSTPVEIVGKRGLIRARIEMVAIEGSPLAPLPDDARADSR